MSKLVFLFGIHNHQPVGNFPSVLEKAFRDCYQPFLEQLAAHPRIRFTLHFSGPLWEYMEKQARDTWQMVKELVDHGQVELLGGGFYEPILAIIPEQDRQGQLQMMNQFLKEKFNFLPRGAWLAERVWEPHLAKTLALAGIEYTLLDEEHFHYAGIKNIHMPYLTEEEGFPLVLFPIDKKLRYLIPFREIGEIGQYFGEIERRGGVAILADDGEKFGLWPGTRKWVYEEGWLVKFLRFLEEKSIQTMTCSEYLDLSPAFGQVYIPPASYEEMMEWVLEPEAQQRLKEMKKEFPSSARRLLRGGFFREFFLKYPESNHLHKRMLGVSRLVAQQSPANKKAVRELYQAQCNDAYWHGVFGGLYLPHLREAVYSHLLQAEKSSRIDGGWKKSDYDLDKKEEVFYRDQLFSFLFKPSFGGSLVEVDFLPLARNLTNVLSRREEFYHRPQSGGTSEGKSIHELAKHLPPGADSLLRYDWHPRYSLLDHFLHPRTTPDDFRRIDYGEQGDFVNQEYRFSLQRDRLVLERKGHVWQDEDRLPVAVQKIIIPQAWGIEVDYEIMNLSSTELHFIFGSEWNFSFLPGEWEKNLAGLQFLGRRLELTFSPSPEVWSFPLETLSQSEEGYDIIQQGVCFLPHWRISLPGQKKFIFTATLRVKDER